MRRLYFFTRIAIIFAGFLVSIPSKAQEYVGLFTDNYAGVHAMHVQPASLASTPYKWDINIISADLIGYNAEFFTNLAVADRFNEVGKGSFFRGLTDGENSYLINVGVMLPSVSYSINDKSSVSFSTRVRAKTNIETNDSNIMSLIIDDFEDSADYGKTFVNGDLSANFNTWIEYNFNYAREVLRKDNHVMRVGIAPKLISGTGSGYFSINDLNFTVEDRTRLSGIDGDVFFGYSSSIDDVLNGEIGLLRNISFGLNLGVEYEFRKTGYEDLTGNEFDPGYTWKVGLSYIDHGSLKYEIKNANSQFIADILELDLDNIRAISSVEALADTLSSILDESVGRDEYRMSLPSTFSVQIDRRITDHFYANFSTFIRTKGQGVFQINRPNQYFLTLRYQKRKWGAQLPLSVNSISGTRVGLAGRYGMFSLGSADIFSALFSSDPQKFNLYLALKFRIWKDQYKRVKKG
ncbi:MAG: DUF5723 family protein [Cyclobacteriaceae bacterium]